MNYPLEKLRVLDLARVLAGPYAGRMLSDLGADVVKVEPPDGDVTRLWGAVHNGIPGYFNFTNAGKRNVCIDLRDPEGVALLKQLVAEADILIENYRPGVMARLGIAYEELSTINPRLIMLSISGFGQDGPESQRPAYAPVLHAESGLLARQLAFAGRTDVDADVGMSVADTNAALHGLIGLLAALHMRNSTGTGQHIDIAMLDSMIGTDDYLHYVLEDAEHTAPLRSRIWQTAGGPMLITGDFRFIWKGLNEQCGVADPTPAGATLEEKITHRLGAAEHFFTEVCRTREEVIAVFDKLNFAWGDARDSASLPQSPTVQHRQSIAQVDDRGGGTRPVVQSPYRFSAARSGIRGGTAHKGEHNAAVLQDWLDLDADGLAGLLASPALHRDDVQELED